MNTPFTEIEKLAGLVFAALTGWVVTVSTVLGFLGIWFIIFAAASTPNPLWGVLYGIFLLFMVLLYSIPLAIPLAVFPSLLFGWPLWKWAEMRGYREKYHACLMGVFVAHIVLLNVIWAVNGYRLSLSDLLPNVIMYTIIITPIGMLAGTTAYNTAHAKSMKRLEI